MTKQKDKDFEEYISNHTCEDELFEEYEEDLCEDKECDCSHHNHAHNPTKPCIIYEDRPHCINCGECEMCDLDPTKKCDNCGQCLEEYNFPVDEKGFYNFEAVLDTNDMTLDDMYKAYGLDDEEEDEE